jgi:5-hydroxyisourate hydrolase-like protein (transthyretin family)
MIAHAGTVHGTVKNGTTGKPAAGVEVILIQLQGGMQPVANSKSDAQGQFSFDHPGLGAQPMLVRAVYRGVNFHQPVPPGTSVIEVDVFDLSKDAKTITVPTHLVIFQPNGSTLNVGEEYSIENKSQPPQAYFRADGNFDFALPEKAQLQQVAAAGPAGMPVVQAPIDRNNDHYAIAYAFRPGQSMVRYSYDLPYTGNSAIVKIPTVHSGGKLIVVAPPTMQISGEGLLPAGQEQGMSLYSRDNVSAGTLVSVNVSGTAPPPQEANGGGAEGGQPQGRDAQQGGESGGAGIQQVPGRLDVLKWPLIAGFVGVFALGAILLARRPVVAVAGAAVGDEEQAPVAKPKKPKSVTPPAAQAAVAAPAKPARVEPAGLAGMDTAVGTSLDSLKENLFRLELRHQAGTISEDEYVRERARAEKVLRDLVRG